MVPEFILMVKIREIGESFIVPHHPTRNRSGQVCEILVSELRYNTRIVWVKHQHTKKTICRRNFVEYA